ncbi:transcriptional regulator [Lysobacter antibioticus]|uniref:transcriptional regulator n=1 Tax=Lysobacter antibioticus TaxID=84531 RepID=UPI00094F1B8B|nr:helix-turn-helix domain-containing protein [Lysobacter antibioticus]
MSTEPLDRAIAILSGQKALADAIGVKSPSISGWYSRGVVPAKRCRAIEMATGGQVTCHDLRPDIFGPKPANDEPSAEEAA